MQGLTLTAINAAEKHAFMETVDRLMCHVDKRTCRQKFELLCQTLQEAGVNMSHTLTRSRCDKIY